MRISAFFLFLSVCFAGLLFLWASGDLPEPDSDARELPAANRTAQNSQGPELLAADLSPQAPDRGLSAQAAGRRSPNQAARSLVVHVRVQEHFGQNAPAVPDVGVVVGLGYAEEGSTIPSLAGRAELARGLADADGNLILAVELPDLNTTGESRADSPMVFAYVDHPGYQARTRASPLPTEGEEFPWKIELRVQAKHGATVRGVLLNPASEPVPGAKVILYRFNKEQAGKIEYRSRVNPRTSRIGTFEAQIDVSGDWQLQARVAGTGVAGLRDIPIDILDPPQDLQLQLEGPGVLTGRVVDPTGEPMQRYRLWAIPENSAESRSGWFSENTRCLNEMEGGLFDAYATTDSQGFFRFSGLKLESYHIRGTLAGSGYFDALLTEEPVRAGTEDLLLRAHNHRVRLTLRESTGENVAFGTFKVLGTSRTVPHPKPLVYVAETDEAGRVLKPNEQVQGRRTELEDLSQVIEVEAGKRYVFGVFSTQFALQEKVVLIPHKPYAIDLEIQLGTALEPGTLEIEVQDSWGQPIPGKTNLLLRAPSEQRLFETNWASLPGGQDQRGDEHLLTLAPGIYQLEVGPTALPMPHAQATGRARLAFTAVQKEVEAFPGSTHRIPVRLGDAGWLDLEVHLESPPHDLPFPSTAPEITESQSHPLDTFRKAAGGIAVRFEPLGGGPVLRGAFQHSELSPIHPGRVSAHRSFQFETSWIFPNRVQHALDPLPVGHYLGIFEREGYQPQTVKLEIRSGETAYVHTMLTPLTAR